MPSNYMYTYLYLMWHLVILKYSALSAKYIPKDDIHTFSSNTTDNFQRETQSTNTIHTVNWCDSLNESQLYTTKSTSKCYLVCPMRVCQYQQRKRRGQESTVLPHLVEVCSKSIRIQKAIIVETVRDIKWKMFKAEH